MNQKKNIYCLTPIYNDWESFAILIQEIYQLKQNLSTYDFFIVAVNDGSTQDLPEDFDYKNIPTTVLNLKINIDLFILIFRYVSMVEVTTQRHINTAAQLFYRATDLKNK